MGRLRDRWPSAVGGWAGLVRLGTAVITAVYVAAYRPLPAHPPPGFVRPAAWALTAALALSGVAQLHSRIARSRAAALVLLAGDLAATLALLSMFAFDPRSPLFSILLLASAESAVVLGLPRALLPWALLAGSYAAKEVWGQRAFGVPPDFGRVSLRATVTLVVVVAGGSLIRQLGEERRRRHDEEIKYRKLVEEVPAVTYTTLLDAQESFVYVSPQVESMLGFPADEWITTHDFWEERLHPDDRERVFEANERVNRTGEPWRAEYRLVARDGTIVWVRDEATVVRDEQGRARFWQGVLIDVTERRVAEDARSDSERLARSTMDALSANVAVLDERGEIVAVNRAWRDFASANDGTPSELANGTNYLQVCERATGEGSDHARRAASGVRDVLSARAEVFTMEYPCHAPDAQRWFVMRVTRFPGADPARAVVAHEDISDRVRAEEQLREAEAKYRTLVEHIPAITYVEAFDANIDDFYISPQVATMLGYDPEQWRLGQDFWYEHIHPDDRERVVAEDQRTNVTGDPYAIEYRLVAADGRAVWVRDEAVLVPTEDGKPKIWQGFMIDITARKQAEDELQRSLERLRRTDEQRRRLLSELVRAQEAERQRIASDIHDDPIQKMTAVGLRIQMLANALRSEAQRRMVDEVSRTVELTLQRMRHLLFELRPPALDRDGLVTALRQYLDRVEAESGTATRLTGGLVTEPPIETRTIAYRIAQEAVNNARKHADARTIEVAVESRDQGVHVRVRDDGGGFVPSAELERARPGHLGVVTMRERAELAGGWWRIDSGPGEGTTVAFWLPAEETARERQAAS